MPDMPISEQILKTPYEGESAPDGSIPVACVLVLNYMDPDGEVYRKWHTEGEPTTEEIIGMLEMAKLRICADTYGWDAPDDS
jgi:hypothetical protein